MTTLGILLRGALVAGILALTSACAPESPDHDPWPTLPEKGTGPATAVQGGGGKLTKYEPIEDVGFEDPQTKDAGETEN
jgi:hypothetical protein